MALSQNILKCSKLCDVFSFSKLSIDGAVRNPFCITSVRTSKHYNPKYKWHRGKKFLPVDLPDEESKKKTFVNFNKLLKKYDLDPPRYWKERAPTITSLNDILDPYVPPEADGKASILSKEGSKELLNSLNKKRTSMMAIRKIKQYDHKFDVKLFAQEAHDIYVNAHMTLAKNDYEALTEFATEKAAVDMSGGLKNKTLRWKFIESLEAPVVVHARTESSVIKTDLFAQVTVRFHTKQALAIYDRFGRLFYGSEILSKDVLEYVVFEKHIVNEYGVWRLHGKIIPDWIPRGQPVARTMRIESDEGADELDEMSMMEQEQELNIGSTEVVKEEPDVPAKSQQTV